MHLFFETSALDGSNIDEVFYQTAELTLEQYQTAEGTIDYEDNVVRLLDPKKKSDQCNLNPCSCS